jgi:hypothetical protein
MKPQQILDEFHAAMARSETVCKMALNRPSGSIAACVRKIIAAARQDALHIVQAADAALAALRDDPR